ncbi:hypothetical protein [Burkholderia pyrrocinia]|uniref:hypothetical protein n=1 Tax=Burkholderia pyrrocinia TaxID=60550 RepID=UPI001BCC867B|nr:hypothetical protein [Burkholderia pyrrocinia]QVN18755.1 hypothetical protein JYG32_03195 [Burkholderia pyrrocinia]
MKKLLFAIFVLLWLETAVLAQSYPSPTYKNVTLQNALAVTSGGTGTTTATGTGSVVLSTSPTISSATLPNVSITSGNSVFTNSSIGGTFSITNGSDVINANNNANNVLVFSGTGSSTAKFISTLSKGGFIPSSDTNVSDGIAFRSDFINTAVFQGMNPSGTAGYDTNLTLYRPASTNNAFLGVTMSPTPGAEQHLWMGTDYVNNRYTFTETITGTGTYLPITFLNGQAQAFQIGTGTTPTTTFSGGGVVLNGTEGNQITWTLGGQTWSWNMASGGNFYIHDGTNNKFPLTVVPNSTASLQIGPGTSTFTGSITPSSTAGIVGTTTNDNANAGSVGEYQSVTGSSTGLTSGSYVDLATLSLTAGDWDTECTVSFVPNASTTVSALVAGVNTVANTNPMAVGNGTTLVSIFTTGSGQLIATPVVRESLSSTTTIRCGGQSNFGTSTMNAIGFLRARRIR